MSHSYSSEATPFAVLCRAAGFEYHLPDVAIREEMLLQVMLHSTSAASTSAAGNVGRDLGPVRLNFTQAIVGIRRAYTSLTESYGPVQTRNILWTTMKQGISSYSADRMMKHGQIPS